MKKINSLSESDFLKVLFGFFAVAFLAAATIISTWQKIGRAHV